MTLLPLHKPQSVGPILYCRTHFLHRKGSPHPLELSLTYQGLDVLFSKQYTLNLSVMCNSNYYDRDCQTANRQSSENGEHCPFSKLGQTFPYVPELNTVERSMVNFGRGSSLVVLSDPLEPSAGTRLHMFQHFYSKN